MGDVYSTDLSRVRNLTQGQLDSMLGDSGTIIPKHLKRPEHWPLLQVHAEEIKSEQQQILVKKLAASSPVDYLFDAEGKITIADTPLNTPPPVDHPEELEDIIFALEEELSDLVHDLLRGKFNFDIRYLRKQIDRYGMALDAEKLSWHRLESKMALVRKYMQDEDAINTWNQQILDVSDMVMELHSKLEAHIRPKQPETVPDTPEVNLETLQDQGLVAEAWQEAKTLLEDEDTKKLFSSDAQAHHQDLVDVATDPEKQRAPEAIKGAAQKFSAMMGFVKRETGKIAKITGNIKAIMFNLWAIVRFFASFFS